MGFNYWNYKLDPSWHDSIITVKIDVDSVNSNDNDTATKTIKKKNILLLTFDTGVVPAPDGIFISTLTCKLFTFVFIEY